MSKLKDKSMKRYFTFTIENRRYIIRERNNGTFYTTFINIGGN